MYLSLIHKMSIKWKHKINCECSDATCLGWLYKSSYLVMIEYPEHLEQKKITDKMYRLPKQCGLPVALLINGEVSGR